MLRIEKIRHDARLEFVLKGGGTSISLWCGARPMTTDGARDALAQGMEIIARKVAASERSALVMRLSRLVQDELGRGPTSEGHESSTDETAIRLMREHYPLWKKHIETVVGRQNQDQADTLAKFAPHFLSTLAIDGTDPEAIAARMDRLVKLQVLPICGPYFVANFYGPECRSFPLRIERCSDINFSDVNAVTGATGFSMARVPSVPGFWTNEQVKEVLRHVVGDFSADGEDIEAEYALCGDTLEISLRIP